MLRRRGRDSISPAKMIPALDILRTPPPRAQSPGQRSFAAPRPVVVRFPSDSRSRRSSLPGRGPWAVIWMRSEKSKGRPSEDESTEARHKGGTARSSEEAPVMGVERRGCVVQRVFIDQPGMGGISEYSQARPYDLLNNGSRVSRELLVRFCKQPSVKFPWLTLPEISKPI